MCTRKKILYAIGPDEVNSELAHLLLLYPLD